MGCMPPYFQNLGHKRGHLSTSEFRLSGLTGGLNYIEQAEYSSFFSVLPFETMQRLLFICESLELFGR